jgi:hypothetical protein
VLPAWRFLAGEVRRNTSRRTHGREGGRLRK